VQTTEAERSPLGPSHPVARQGPPRSVRHGPRVGEGAGEAEWDGTSFFDGYGNLTPDVTHERIKQPRSAASCTPRAATAEQ